LEGDVFTPTTSGTPQGGVISPLLANIALHGLEEVATQAYYRRDNGAAIRPTLIRYADDFVILCRDLDGIIAARVAVEQWLKEMGLHLSPTKTRITHTLHPYDGHVGFDFLGFTVRQYPVGQTHSGKGSGGHLLGFKTLITPSKEAVTRHLAAIGQIIRRHKGSPQAELIGQLNPVIRGWANYYRTKVSRDTFERCDHIIYIQLQRWARRRHPGKSRQWVAARYWNLRPGAMWHFVVKANGRITCRLTEHEDIHIRRYVKVKGRATPFDGNLPYWAQRLKNHPLTDSTLGRLLVSQHGRCARCGLTFTAEDLIEIDHVLRPSQGGSNHLTNKQALHRHCHDQKTAEEIR
jgi:RNA-directed DNA polymerase